MLRYAEHQIPSHLPESDKELIRKANYQRYEEIDTCKASTEEARAILHDIEVSKYHMDECRCGME